MICNVINMITFPGIEITQSIFPLMHRLHIGSTTEYSQLWTISLPIVKLVVPILLFRISIFIEREALFLQSSSTNYFT